MLYFDKLKSEFLCVAKTFNESSSIQQILQQNISTAHYVSIFREIFHHARENPQLQALATVYLRGSQRRVIKQFFKHATSEIGHDQLALDDIQALNGDITNIRFENPLPETTALIAFPFYQIYNHNPVGYIGYLFFLEFLPTQFGPEYIKSFQAIGIPKTAMTFLLDHTTVDVAHNKFMEGYIEQLIQNDNEFQTVLYAMKVTANLYLRMIDAAIRRVTTHEQYGLNHLEKAHSLNL